MNSIFTIVALTLDFIGSVTGFTYREINIIAYYIVLPFVYVALVDRIIHRHILKIIYALSWTVAVLLIRDFKAFSDTFFSASVDFLLWFSHVGLDYIAASVVICVILPAIALMALLLFAFPSLRQKIAKYRKLRLEPAQTR